MTKKKLKREFQKDVLTKQLRSFGLILSILFSTFGFWPIIFQGGGLRLWALIIAGSLVVISLIFPNIMNPIYRAWMTIGSAMGWVNTRLILSICYFGILTPIGLSMRFLGKKLMELKFDPEAETYRINRLPRPDSHMEKQF